MSSIVEFILTLKDKMSGSLDRVTDKSDKTRRSLDNLKKTQVGVDKATQHAGKSVKQLKDELTKLKSMRDLLPTGSEDQLKRVNKQIQDVERNIKRAHTTGRTEESRNRTAGRGGLGFLANPLMLAGTAAVGAAAYSVREGGRRDYARRQFQNDYGNRGGSAFHRSLNNSRSSLGDGVFENGNILAKSGYNLSAIGGLMKQLGDVANGDESKLGALTDVFATMKKDGKFSLDLLEDMNKNGFYPLEILSKKTGENFRSMFDRIRDGKFSVDEISSALDYATSAGGDFFGNLDKLADSPLSKMERLGDTITNIAANFGENILGIGESIAGFFDEHLFKPIENLDKESYWGKVFNNLDRFDKAVGIPKPSNLFKENMGRDENIKPLLDKMDLDMGSMDLAGDFLRDLKKTEVNRREKEATDKKEAERINRINGGGQRIYNITVGKLIETMNNTFQGTVKENAAQIGQIINEELIKALSSTAGR